MPVLSAYVHSLFAGGHVANRHAEQPDDWQAALQAAYAEGARHVLLDAGFDALADDAVQALLGGLPPGIYLTAAALHVRPHGWWPQVGLVDGAPHLFRADLPQPGGGSQGSGPAPLPVQRRRGRPRKHPLPSGLSPSSSEAQPENLGVYLEQAWARLGEHDRDILHARLGIDGEPRTLEQIAHQRVPEVSRERIRQLEQRALKTLRELPASAQLLRRLRALIRSDQPLLALPDLHRRDPWFDAGISQQPWFEKLLRALAEGEIDTVEHEGQSVLVPFPLAHWQHCVQQARTLLHRLSSEDCLLSVAQEQVGHLLEERHAAFRPLLWQAAGGDQVQCATGPDGQVRVVAMGQGAKELVKVVLFEAAEPLHREQVVQLVRGHTNRDISDMSITNALPDVGVLMARGHYGLRRHLPYSDEQIDALVEAAESLVLSAPVARQWSTEEICRAIRDEGLFDGELDPYLLGACLRLHGTRLIDLKKGVWEPADGALGERIMIRDFIVELLQEEGRPLSTEELKNALRERRGLAATFQIQPRDPLVRLGKALWGLIDRDLPVPVPALAPYVDTLEAHLRRSNEGIHVSEITGILRKAGLEVDWVEDAELFVALAQRRPQMRVTPGRYLALSDWADERRLTPTAAIRAAVADDPMRTAAAIAADASARARREIGVDAVRYILNNCDYTYDRESGGWCQLALG
jgi:hypothetical protein